MKKLPHLIFVTLISFGTPALAHTDAYLDSLTTPHGGQVRMVGSYHFELLVEKTQVTIYVTDHAFQPQVIKEAKATLTIIPSPKAKAVTVELMATGENQLVGKGEFTVTPEMEMIVSITLNGQAQQARFQPWIKMQAKSNSEVAKEEKGGKDEKTPTSSSMQEEHGGHQH